MNNYLIKDVQGNHEKFYLDETCYVCHYACNEKVQIYDRIVQRMTTLQMMMFSFILIRYLVDDEPQVSFKGCKASIWTLLSSCPCYILRYCLWVY